MESSRSFITRDLGSWRLCRYVCHDADNKTQDQARKIHARHSAYHHRSARDPRLHTLFPIPAFLKQNERHKR